MGLILLKGEESLKSVERSEKRERVSDNHDNGCTGAKACFEFEKGQCTHKILRVAQNDRLFTL